VPLHRLVTRASYFRRRCARRRAAHKTDRCVFALTPRSPRWRGVYHRDRFGASPRRSRWPLQTSTEAGGFPCRPVRDARSAEWELMSPFIWTPPVCQGILCAGRQEGCGFISGLVAGRTRWPRWIPLAHASFVTRAVSPQRASGLVSPGLTCVPSHSITLRNL
jgi:hypothetical protein